MPIEEDPKRVQAEHGSYFEASTEEEEVPPEQRFAPVEVDLSQPAPKKGANGETAPVVDNAATEELRSQLRRAEQTAAAATQAAREQSQRAQLAEQRAMGASVGMIDSALEAATAEAANAKAAFQAALDAADHAAAAEAQEKLTDARSNLLRLKEQRAMVEAEARRPPQQPRPPQQQQEPRVNIEVVARDLIQSGYPRSAEWLRAHPEWASAPDRMKRVSSAHNNLVDNHRLVPETDEYFEALEQELGIQRRAAPTPERRGPAASAPTSSSSVSLRTGQTQSRSHVTLTPAQQEAAEISGMSNREYAEAFENARASGKLIGYR